MAFLGKIKKAFGFSGEDIENELSDDLQSALVTPLKKPNLVPETGDDGLKPVKAVTQQVEEIEAVVPDELFDAVVKFFNDSLPPFIKDNLDAEKQRQQLYESLSDSMKEYIKKLNYTAERNIEIRWNDEHNRIRKEMEDLRERSKQIEGQSSELKELKLSAERQKRALSERVHDLEAQIAAFDAEREQYELENKSLVNKLRSASVQDEDIKALSDDNDALREQIRLLKTGISPDTGTDSKHFDEEIEKRDAEIDVLNSNIERLEADKKQLLDDVALLKKRCEIADTMINDLNKRASSAQQLVTQRESELATLKEELESLNRSVKDDASEELENDIAELQKNIDDRNDEISRLSEALTLANNDIAKKDEDLALVNSELDECNKAIAMFEDALAKFEEIKAAKNQTISELKNEIASLKSTIENNLNHQAESEAALRQEIDRLKTTSSAATRTRRVRKTKEADIFDETLDDTDWLISSPPEGENARPSSVSDAEFGYQEPKRKDSPSDNSAQMLLW